MKTNVFFKSVMRQPARTMLLALLMIVASFAFVVRVVEFVVVNDELQRIEGLYTSVSILAPLNPQNISQDFDVRDAMEIIAQSPYVSREDRRIFVQGVMEDRTNITAQLLATNHFMPFLEGLDIFTQEHYFYATIRFTQHSPRLITTGDQHFIHVTVDVTENVVGDSMLLRDTTSQFVSVSGRPLFIPQRADMRIAITHEESYLYAAGLWNPFEGLGSQTQYFMRALPTPTLDGDGIPHWWLRPTIGEDGLVGSSNWSVAIDPDLRDDELVFFHRITDGASYTAMREAIQPQIDLARDNLQSMMVIGTQDMTTMPRMQNWASARLIDTPLIQGGRWLTYEDYINQNPVAVVPFQMAVRKGLRVGETFTITLNNNPRPKWIDEDSTSLFAPQIEGWWAVAPQGWWATAQGGEHFYEREHVTLELTVVGVYHNTPPGISHNFLSTEMYIPLSLIPEGFGWDDSPHLSSMYSFVLNSPRDEQSFLQGIEIALLQQGFVARFLENGFDAFVNAADPIFLSLIVNLVTFCVLSVLILALVIFLYLREWRKSLAITRALGSPSGKTLRQMIFPVIVLWIPAIIIGAVVAWFFALSQAETTLEGINAAVGIADSLVHVEEAVTELPQMSWFMLLAVAVTLLTFGDLFAAIAKWRKNIVISRANAISAGENPKWLLSQVFPMWTPLVLAAAAIVWVFALNEMEHSFAEIFAIIGAGATNLSLDVTWLILMSVSMAAIVFGGLAIFGNAIIRRPVLEQLQGAITKNKKRKTKIAAEANEMPVKFDTANANFVFAAVQKSSKNSRKSAFNHIWLHIRRMPFKAGLVAAIAFAFTMSLGLLHHTILVTEAEIEYLWENTEIKAELVRNPDTENLLLGDMGIFAHVPISRLTVERLLETEHVIGVSYLEALWRYGYLRSADFFEQDAPFFGELPWQEQTDVILAVSGLDGLAQENIRTPLDDVLGVAGNAITFNFAEGFDASDFVFATYNPIPVIVRSNFLQEHGYAFGDILMFDYPELVVQVIGTFEGGLSRSVNRFGEERSVVILPLEALLHNIPSTIRVHRDGGSFNRSPSYTTARFLIDPLYIAEFRQETEELLNWNVVPPAGRIELELLIDDSILRNTIAPMEQNLALLQILYPIAIGVSVVLSIGFAFLVMMQNAKNAAIMRVLGKTRMLTQLMLSGEQIILCVTGVLLGLLALSLFGADIFNITPLLLALLYFTCATFGSVFGSVVISSKTPLELLQTKE